MGYYPAVIETTGTGNRVGVGSYVPEVTTPETSVEGTLVSLTTTDASEREVNSSVTGEDASVHLRLARLDDRPMWEGPPTGRARRRVPGVDESKALGPGKGFREETSGSRRG